MNSEVTIKNNEVLLIRKAVAQDAEKMIAQLKMVGDETQFLSFSGEEFVATVEEEKKIIADHNDSDNQIMILGIIDDEIACVMNVMASHKSRLKHVGEFGLSVSKKHWNKGVGRAMINYTIDWAKENEILKKLNLQVNVTNVKAIKLYESLGFKHEGRQAMDIYLNGEYLDGILMGMVL
ncbi:MAG: RimJ/RimL family protein N-acetyltransferase [Granulosicoccus sp.]|jgi:RimJ/RimL family protein N-acetyltransferase